MTTKKPCINFPSVSYSGKEQSPLRYGLSAEGYIVNSVMEGYDKNYWSVEVKNNKKVWVRKDDTFKITHEEPVIKSTEDFTNNNTSVIILNENNDIECQLDTIAETSNETIKKPTDYNVYLSYRLNILKEENAREIDGKSYFKQVIEEWKILKKNPVEVQKIIKDINKYNTAPEKTEKTVRKNKKK